ncbi:LGRD-like protein [Mya arenaria]|uniref:LGRD-like protein n=1 Tax=Mya arenaria TaxID=6604 RepID=A0ABY7EUY7_MYAAR|nr:LGRD-like protein [Mya arenaria]
MDDEGQIDDEGHISLIVACKSGNAEQVKPLLEEGDFSEKTALHHCADNLDTQCAGMLLDKNPYELEEQDMQRRLLLDQGADLNVTNHEEHLLTYWAAECGQLKTLDILDQRSADQSPEEEAKGAVSSLEPVNQPCNLHAIPPVVGVLDFNNDVDTIFNAARALEFGHHVNAIGSPKIKTPSGQFCLVTNVIKWKHTSKYASGEAGKILYIVSDSIVVATQTNPIQVSVADLHGASISSNLFVEYGLIVGNRLGNVLNIKVDRMVLLRKREAFWRKQMCKYKPTVFYRQKMNVFASTIDTSPQVCIKKITIDLPKIVAKNIILKIDISFTQACFVAFLARVNCTSKVHIGMLADKIDIPTECSGLYSDITPCVFEIDNHANVADVIDTCMEDIKQNKDAGTYLVDMVYRYPELKCMKRTPYHNIVLAHTKRRNLPHNELQSILNECNVLLFFGENDETQLEVLYQDRPTKDSSHVIDVLQHFSSFLTALETSTQDPLKCVSLVTRNDLNKFYPLPTRREIENEMTEDLSELIEKQCKLTPVSIAIKSTENMMTYSKLASETNILKRKLLKAMHSSSKKMTKPVIALHMPNSIAYVVSLLAVTNAHLTFLPIPVDLPTDRIVFTIKDSGVRQMIMTKEWYAQCYLNELASSMRVLFEHQILEDTLVMVDFGVDKITKNENNNDVLYLMYTSGSTGRPKGVEVKESSTINLARAQIQCWDLLPGDIIGQFASIGFDASVSEVFTALLSGASLAVLGKNERLGSDFVSAVTKMKVSVITLPPSALNIYSPDEFPFLRKVITAGEACTLNVALKWTADREVRFFNAYGPTEATICATCYEHLPETVCNDVNCDLPIGKAIDGAQVYIFDEFMHPVPPGVVGEIYIGGKGLAHGYIGHASDLTKQRFVQNPLTDRKCLLYKTGDHAFQHKDGNLTYVGRTDNQVKIRGNRIDLNEIEQVLIQHPKIEMAVVVVHKCETIKDLAVAAYVAPTLICTSELREYLANILPNFMIPTYIKKIEVSDLPKTVNGKINRKDLEHDESVHENTFTTGNSNLNELELIVAKHWCKVFNFDKSTLCSFHRQSSFSEQGGNSLQLVLLVRALEEELNVCISFTDLGMADHIDEFAEVIKRRLANQSTDEQDEMKSKSELRELIVHDSELDSFFPYPERRRSVQLTPDTAPRQRQVAGKQPENILLSGVTGFLGVFLLSEILEQSNFHVFCMVRESTDARGIGRIIDNMRKYELWKDEYTSRIAVVLSDLSQESLGIAPDVYRSLCADIDVVFMNAAMMNFNTPYEGHRVTNVLSTKEIIRLASTGVHKYLFTTSSLSVFLFPSDKVRNACSRQLLSESEFFDDPLCIEGGYGQSKWASERLVMQALDFLPGGAIFRPARISGRSTDGMGPKNDTFASTMIGMNKMGSYPDMDFPYDLVPVDFCARSMIEITLQICQCEDISPPPRMYHLFNQDTIPFRELFKGMGLKALPLEEWRNELRRIDSENKHLVTLTPFFLSKYWDRAPDWPIFETSNVEKVISEKAKMLVKPIKELLPLYKRFFGLE